jgi:hypothetical protein
LHFHHGIQQKPGITFGQERKNEQNVAEKEFWKRKKKEKSLTGYTRTQGSMFQLGIKVAHSIRYSYVMNFQIRNQGNKLSLQAKLPLPREP